MFRAISEIAVATSVASVRVKPSSRASARPCARAGTMSTSDSSGTRISFAIVVPSARPVEKRERLVEVEGRMEGFEVEIELRHGDRDVRLDSDDERLCASKPGGDGDGAEGASAEGVDDINPWAVDDDPA